MTKVVRPRVAASSAACNCRSVVASRALVASSKIMIGGSLTSARAIPDAGQVFTFHGFRFEVLRKTRNRITSLKISPLGAKAIRKAAKADVQGAGF